MGGRLRLHAPRPRAGRGGWTAGLRGGRSPKGGNQLVVRADRRAPAGIRTPRHPQGAPLPVAVLCGAVRPRRGPQLPRVVPPHGRHGHRRVDAGLLRLSVGGTAPRRGRTRGEDPGTAARPGRPIPLRSDLPPSHGRPAHVGHGGRCRTSGLLCTVARPTLRVLPGEPGAGPAVRAVPDRSRWPTRGDL